MGTGDGYVLALDEGTTSARALVFDRGGVVRGVSRCSFPQIYPVSKQARIFDIFLRLVIKYK